MSIKTLNIILNIKCFLFFDNFENDQTGNWREQIGA